MFEKGMMMEDSVICLWECLDSCLDKENEEMKEYDYLRAMLFSDDFINDLIDKA
jgi:hypothetical protein